MYHGVSLFLIERLSDCEVRPIGSYSEARPLKVLRLAVTLYFRTDATTNILFDFMFYHILPNI